MVDAAFGHPRLVAIYDALDPDRSDLEAYAGIVAELGAHAVLDVGCGTGAFALLLAERGLDVIGLDPAAGSLAVARQKPGAARVRWIHGDATALLAPPIRVDVATMTGNVAQAIVSPVDWADTLAGVHDAVRPGGHLVLETRDPADRAWERWTRAASYTVTDVDVDGVGIVETWVEVTGLELPLVTFVWTFVFRSDGAVLTSESTLRFRERDDVEVDLRRHGFVVREVRDAPDRPGRELVFIAESAP